MKTTLIAIVSEAPGGDLVDKLLKQLNKTKADGDLKIKSSRVTPRDLWAMI